MIRCLIVDDEPPARELIASYISRLNDMEVVEQCSNALDAFTCLQNQDIDLMFLDIQMPKMTGLELIKALQHPPKIILTTAFKEHASEGFDLDVLDYLVKPIHFERFMRSVCKYHQLAPRDGTEPIVENSYDQAYLFIKVNKEQVKIFFKEIVVVEGLKDYIRITTRDSSYVTYNRLSYMEEILPESRFVRIHKSYIIALSEVKSFKSDSVKVGDHSYPVGRIYKRRFTDALEAYQKGSRKVN